MNDPVRKITNILQLLLVILLMAESCNLSADNNEKKKKKYCKYLKPFLTFTLD